MRRKYPSDLSDTRWCLIQKFLRDPVRTGRKRSTDVREVVNAINYRWTTGCPWRMLPHDFPAWETVYTYFARWQKDGRLRLIREIVLRKSPYSVAKQLNNSGLPTGADRFNGRLSDRCLSPVEPAATLVTRNPDWPASTDPTSVREMPAPSTGANHGGKAGESPRDLARLAPPGELGSSCRATLHPTTPER